MRVLSVALLLTFAAAVPQFSAVSKVNVGMTPQECTAMGGSNTCTYDKKSPQTCPGVPATNNKPYNCPENGCCWMCPHPCNPGAKPAQVCPADTSYENKQYDCPKDGCCQKRETPSWAPTFKNHTPAPTQFTPECLYPCASGTKPPQMCPAKFAVKKQEFECPKDNCCSWSHDGTSAPTNSTPTPPHTPPPHPGNTTHAPTNSTPTPPHTPPPHPGNTTHAPTNSTPTPPPPAPGNKTLAPTNSTPPPPPAPTKAPTKAPIGPAATGELHVLIAANKTWDSKLFVRDLADYLCASANETCTNQTESRITIGKTKLTAYNGTEKGFTSEAAFTLTVGVASDETITPQEEVNAIATAAQNKRVLGKGEYKFAGVDTTAAPTATPKSNSTSPTLAPTSAASSIFPSVVFSGIAFMLCQ